MQRGKAKGRISVRRMQMKLLEQGNATMGVWLGKNILGQVDEIRHDIGNPGQRLFIVLPRLDDPVRFDATRKLNSPAPDCTLQIEAASYESLEKTNES